MTNRLILDDPEIGTYPASARQWNALQRQLAEATAPGFSSVILLDNFTATSTTPATVTDGNGVALSISLRANVKYSIGLFGAYNRQSADHVRVQLAFSGTTAGSPEDASWAHYIISSGGEFSDHERTPLTAMSMESANTKGYTFGANGFMNISVAGELTILFNQINNDGVVDATLYSGTMLIAQPILNLSDRSNVNV